MQHRPMRSACVNLVVLMAAATLAAQTPSFKSRVTHVLLDVVVTDKDDRPVTNLTADDFEIVDHGKAQTIADFEKIVVPPGGRAIESLKAIPGPPPDTFTNVAPAHSGRAFVIWVYAIGDIVGPPFLAHRTTAFLGRVRGRSRV